MAAELTPRVSVIIPSHNRRDRLLFGLDAIKRQTFPLEELEVIVVADGCRDDTVAAAKAYNAPFKMSVTELPGVGPAAARNHGAELAHAPLLLFLDDDVEPLEHWVAAHASAHENHPDSVVIGAYPPFPDGSRDEFRQLVRGWWTAHFDDLARPGRRFSYRDIITGNLSVPRALWASLGGLDPSFAKAHEDWEFGLRLIAAEIPIVFAAGAFCWHHEYATMTVEGAIARAREEGRADVRLGCKHPHIKADLPIAAHWWANGMAGRQIGRLAFRNQGAGEALLRALTAVTSYLSKRPSGGLFRRSYALTQRLAYLRGVAAELRSVPDLMAFLNDTPPRKTKSILIDLADGIDLAEQKLAAERPDDVRLMYGINDLGWLPQSAGAERWDRHHLRPWLARHMQGAMIHALRTGEPMPANESWHYMGQKGYFSALSEAVGQWDRSGL